MKKRILSVLFCGVVLANLAGCAGKSQSASDVSDESAFQAEQIGKTEAAAQTASSQEEQTAPESVEETASTQPPAEEEKETPQEQTEGKKPASANPNQAPSRQEREPEPAKPSEPAKASEPESPAETVPAQTAAPENKPEPEPSEPVAQEPEPAQTEPAFDIGYWVSYAKSYAQGVGLALDSGAVYCWDNPITAGSHCIYLERDITNRLNRYSKDGSITQVWVWAEAAMGATICISATPDPEQSNSRQETHRNPMRFLFAQNPWRGVLNYYF